MPCLESVLGLDDVVFIRDAGYIYDIAAAQHVLHVIHTVNAFKFHILTTMDNSPTHKCALFQSEVSLLDNAELSVSQSRPVLMSSFHQPRRPLTTSPCSDSNLSLNDSL